MAVERSAEKEYVLRVARDNDVKFIRLWFTDILGMLKGFALNVDDLEDAIELGVGFDGSAIEGYARIDESDMRALPDPTTFSLLPWRWDIATSSSALGTLSVAKSSGKTGCSARRNHT